jgi:hypothetical protein
MTHHAPTLDACAGKPRGALDTLGKLSAFIVFIVGGTAGFVVTSIKTDAAVEVRLHNIEAEINDLKADHAALSGHVVSQQEFSEVENRMSDNMQRIDESLRALIDEHTARGWLPPRPRR